MGECSFGAGFGQTNKYKELELDIDQRIWRRIPTAIFKGMTRRYQVDHSLPSQQVLEANPKADVESVCLHQTSSEKFWPGYRIRLATRDDCSEFG